MQPKVILQISNEPIDEEDYFEEFELDGFVPLVADCVIKTKSKKRSDYLQELLISSGGGIKKEGNRFIIADKQEYFMDKYERFTEILNELKTSIETFIGNDGLVLSDLHYLNQAFDQKYGYYVVDENQWRTLDSFVRESKDGTAFYIGSIFEYKY